MPGPLATPSMAATGIFPEPRRALLDSSSLDGPDRHLPGAPAIRPAARGAGPRGGRRDAALRLADDGAADAGLRGGLRRASGRAARGRGVELHRGAAPRLPGRRSRSGGRGDRAVVHVCGDRRRGCLLRCHAGVRRDRLAQEPEPRPRGRGAAHHPPHEGGLRRALRRLRRARGSLEGAVRRARDRADRGRRTRPQRDAART